MRYSTHREFDRQSKKLSPQILDRIEERLALLAVDENHPLLHSHKLNPPFDGYRSISITGDYRLVYKRLAADTFFLRAIGTHHQLYGT